MKSFLRLGLSLVLCAFASAQGAELKLRVKLENSADGRIDLELRSSNGVTIGTLQDRRPGLSLLSLADLEQGSYTVGAHSPGYITEWTPFRLERGHPKPNDNTVVLYRKRYAIVHYVVNKAGGRALHGPDVEEGRLAIPQTMGLRRFGTTFQVWQLDQHGKNSGKDIYFRDAGNTAGFGFARARRGMPFNDLIEAAQDTAYEHEDLRAEKGLTFLFRGQGNCSDCDLYGKILVEAITERPPLGVTVIESDI